MTKQKSKSFNSNSISGPVNAFFNFWFSVYCILCVSPLALIFMVSITDEATLLTDGYQFLPKKFDFYAYEFILNDMSKIARAYGVTIAACVIGTALSVLLVMFYAYPISRKKFKYRNFFAFYIFFTMLFNGGLVPWYILYTKYLGLDDNPAMLVIPALVSAFNVLIVKTLFTLVMVYSASTPFSSVNLKEFRPSEMACCIAALNSMERKTSEDFG
jgi:putative aldouronate transport system permease protein